VFRGAYNDVLPVLAKALLINKDKTREKSSPCLFFLQNKNSVSILRSVVLLQAGAGGAVLGLWLMLLFKTILISLARIK
jgi:hypothetical protein